MNLSGPRKSDSCSDLNNRHPPARKRPKALRLEIAAGQYHAVHPVLLQPSKILFAAACQQEGISVLARQGLNRANEPPKIRVVKILDHHSNRASRGAEQSQRTCAWLVVALSRSTADPLDGVLRCPDFSRTSGQRTRNQGLGNTQLRCNLLLCRGSVHRFYAR